MSSSNPRPLAFVFLVLAGLCLPLTSGRANTAVDPAPRDAKWTARHDGFVARAHTGGVQVLFLGDSITDFWRYDLYAGKSRGKATWDREFAPLGAENFGIGGDMTQNVLWRVQNGELTGISPQVVVLLIGINNLSSDKDGKIRNTPQEVTAGIGAIVTQIRQKLPRAKILILGILPRDYRPDTAHRVQVKTVNDALKKWDDGAQVFFLDAGPKFLNADGSLRAEIMADQVHPNAQGYAVLGAEILGRLHELLPAPPAAPPR